MAAIRMIHDEHGATHAYSTNEADDLAKRGWRIEGATPFRAEPAAGEARPEFADTQPAEPDSGPTVASVRAELDGLGIAYDKRFGLDRLLSLLPKG